MSHRPLRRSSSIGGFAAVIGTAVAAVAIKGAVSDPPSRPPLASVAVTDAVPVTAPPVRTTTTITEIQVSGRKRTRVVSDDGRTRDAERRSTPTSSRDDAGSGAAAPSRRSPESHGNAKGGGSSSTPAATNPAPTTQAPAADAARTVNGDIESTMYGPVQVAVVLRGTRITDVLVVQMANKADRSREINDAAVPKLRQQVLDVQSAAIDGVSGATVTADAYALSVQAALDRS